MVSKETFAMTELQAIGCANSADLYEIQMEKTIAIAIRSVDPLINGEDLRFRRLGRAVRRVRGVAIRRSLLQGEGDF